MDKSTWMKEYRQRNKERIKECNYKYCQEHKTEIAEMGRKYRQIPKVKRANVRRTLKYRRTERGKRLFKVMIANYRHLKRANGVKITVGQWRDLCERFNNRCAYCGIHEVILQILYNQKLTIDHVTPVSKGGEHSIENIVPACVSCNSSKSNKIEGD